MTRRNSMTAALYDMTVSGVLPGMGILLTGTYFDIRKKELPVVWLFVCGIIAAAGCILRLCKGEVYWQTLIMTIMPGIFLVFLSFASGRKLGAGDGIIFMMIGMISSLQRVLFVLMSSLLLTSIYSICLLAAGKGKKNQTIPYVPFITAGFVLTVLAGI